jgi:hypothetical protein
MRAFVFSLLLVLISAKNSVAAEAVELPPKQIPAQVWTLEASIKRAAAVAPELRAAEADIASRTGNLTHADAWPNPTVSVRADEKLGIAEIGRAHV